MLQLQLLWSLQNTDREISSIKKEHRLKAMHADLAAIKDNYSRLKETNDLSINRLAINEDRTIKLNEDLKNLDKRVKDYNNKMYEEGINVKDIENIQKDIDANKERIDNIENELLTIMADDEELKKNISNTKNMLSSMKKDFDTLKFEYTAAGETNKNKIEELMLKREGIVRELDNKFLTLYNSLSAKKSNPVSKIHNGICTECGVKLNAVLLDMVRKRVDICTCDHCGRILYLE